MTIVRAIIVELVAMFIDDGSLALLAVVLIAAVTLAVKLLGAPELGGTLLLLLGCLAILADSLRRAMPRR